MSFHDAIQLRNWAVRPVVKILESANFKVLSASNAAIALSLAEGTTETIDMLLSDVEMPQMSGPDLGEMLKKSRPDMHVMLMSGGSNGNLLVLKGVDSRKDTAK